MRHKILPLLASRCNRMLLVILLSASYAAAQNLAAVSEGTLTTSTSDPTIECTLPGNTTAGDLIVLETHFNANRTFSSVTDNCSGGANTWGNRRVTQSTGNTFILAYSTTANSCTGPTTFVINIGGGNSGGSDCIAAAYSSSTGWPATASVNEADAALGSGTGTTTASTGTLTALGAVRLIHSILRLSGSRNITPDTGFTEIDPANRGTHVQRLITSTTFNETVDATWTSAINWEIIASAFAPNAGGAATVPRRRVIEQ